MKQRSKEIHIQGGGVGLQFSLYSLQHRDEEREKGEEEEMIIMGDYVKIVSEAFLGYYLFEIVI